MLGPFVAGLVLGAVLTLWVVWWPYRDWRLHRARLARFRHRWWLQLPEHDLPSALEHARRLIR